MNDTTFFRNPSYPIGTRELINRNTALSLTSYESYLDSSRENIIVTLPDGTINGQMKRILHTATDNRTNATLTPSNFINGRTVRFSTQGDEIILMWVVGQFNTSIGWLAIYHNNAAGNAISPLIA